MPNLSALLKSEMTRLARKELKATVEPLRKAQAGQRREIAELKRQVVVLQRELKSVAKPVRAKSEVAQDAAPVRFSAKGLKTQRAKLGLSANDFGLLVGTTGQSVYKWETGKAVPRAAQRSALAALRGIGKRDAGRRLESMG